jgi:hypothetical protein
VVTAVAVWDQKPTEEQLLEAWLARGWRPTPTATVEGRQVLGYAACVWKPGEEGRGCGG